MTGDDTGHSARCDTNIQHTDNTMPQQPCITVSSLMDGMAAQCSAVGGGAVCCGLQGEVQTLVLILCAQPHCRLQAVEVKRFITDSVKEGAKLVLWMQDMRQQTSVSFTLPARERLMQIYLGYKKLFGHNLIIQSKGIIMYTMCNYNYNGFCTSCLPPTPSLLHVTLLCMCYTAITSHFDLFLRSPVGRQQPGAGWVESGGFKNTPTPSY